MAECFADPAKGVTVGLAVLVGVDLRDPDHFAHVLEHLFTPALEQVGYAVIPPKMLGATLIHAEIIRHLEQSDLVLADLSSHNANVFFELGIRTALSRPVVLVKDKRSGRVPFDLGPINVLEYDESIATWTLKEEIKRLAEHVGDVPGGSHSGNAMWTYFGLTKRGGPTKAGGLDEKVDLLLAEMTKLRLTPGVQAESVDSRFQRFRTQVMYWAASEGIAEPPLITHEEGGDISVLFFGSRKPPIKLVQKTVDLGKELDLNIKFSVQRTSL